MKFLAKLSYAIFAIIQVILLILLIMLFNGTLACLSFGCIVGAFELIGFIAFSGVLLAIALTIGKRNNDSFNRLSTFLILIVDIVGILYLVSFFAPNQVLYAKQQLYYLGEQLHVLQPQKLTREYIGIEYKFSYPLNFNTPYAEFNFPPKGVINTSSDNNGCASVSGLGGIQVNESIVSIDSREFCLVISRIDYNQNQILYEYDYTVSHSGKYITLQYVITTNQNCRGGTPDYQNCLDFVKNYNSILSQTTQQSVSTLTFNK